MRRLLLVFVFIASVVFAEIHIPLFGGQITIRNSSNKSFTVKTEKKTPMKIEKHTTFTIANGTVTKFELMSNTTETKSEASKKRPSQKRPKSDVLNALLSMFGRF